MVNFIEIDWVQNCHKAVDFLFKKTEFFYISQLLSKYLFGSKLVIFGLELLGMSIFKNSPPRTPKRPILAQFSQAWADLCATDLNNMHHSGFRWQRAFHENSFRKIKKTQLTLIFNFDPILQFEGKFEFLAAFFCPHGRIYF